MKRNIGWILAATLILGGCSLAPDYTRPEAPVPDAWPAGGAYEQVQGASGGPAPSEVEWRTFFTDERLRKVIETALENNRDFRIAALNVERARALYGIRRADLFPAVNGGAGATVQRIPADLSSTGEARTAEQYDVNLGISSWEIDFFGRIRSLKDQALEEYLATEEAQRSARILLVSEVTTAYLKLARDRETLRLARETLAAQEDTLRLIQRRYEVGVAGELDLRRAETQVESARKDIALYTRLTAQDENALNLLAGSRAPLSADVLPGDLAGVSPLSGVSAGISSEALLKRPDIVQAEQMVRAANASIGAARAALFPRISLTTSVGTASSELSGLFDSGSDTWLFAPKLSMPMFDARLWSALDATKTELRIALTQYEKAIQTAFREVADALAARGTVEEQLDAQKALVRAATETRRLSQARYDKGIDSYLSVLDAQRSLYGAQQALVALNFDRIVNQVRLYTVLGGGAL